MAKNSMYLYGKNSIVERLKTDPQSIKRVFVQDNFKAGGIIKDIEHNGIPVKVVKEKELTRIKRADRLQGIVAEVKKYAYTEFSDLLKASLKNNVSLIFLDNINDPHNLGSIIRIVACFGGFALIIPSHGSCEVNDTVMHVASGGENYVPVSMVSSMSTAIMKAKDAGYWIAGAVVDEGEDLNKVSLPFPVALVMGSEGKGIRHGIDKRLDLKVTLPMKGAQLSFNVAMATAIFCHEIAKQKQS